MTANVPWDLVLVFGIAGALHFVAPRAYVQIVPPWLAPTPARRLQLVYLSGAAELAGALGVFLPTTRVAAGWGLILLLLAVLPANVYMLTEARRRGARAWQQALLWARLPLQALLVAWVWGSAIRPST